MIYTLTLNPAIDREFTVNTVEFDTVLQAIESQVDFGGKGFNVSRLLKSMGHAKHGYWIRRWEEPVRQMRMG